MNRRSFLSKSISGVAAGTALASPAQRTKKAPVKRPLEAAPLNLEEITVPELSRQMNFGLMTSESLCEKYFQRIEDFDRKGSQLRAVIETNPDALGIARSLDAERKAKGPRGFLHGVPILIKDNIDTGDKMQTTAGSLAFAGSPASQDSFVAARLRAAGAVILGKTNLSEWANFRSTHSVSGWSGRGGQTRNPYALDRNPCGSSSGTGAGISANLAAVGVGSETDGSIVCPSSVCGIVGIKPTVGLISRGGIVPISHTQDTAGPMARTVRDAAILLGALTGIDPNDPATAASDGKYFTDYTRFLDAGGLQGARLGIARQYFTINPRNNALMQQCVDLMRNAGAVIVDPVEFPQMEPWSKTEQVVLLYEFKNDLNAYLAKRNGPLRSLADCIAFNLAHRIQEMPYFEQELMEQAQAKGDLTQKEYLDALALNRRTSRAEGIDAVITQHQLDAIVAPTAPPSWMTDLVDGDHADGGCSSPAAVAGYPHITVPAGFEFGLPVGISFFAGAWTEPKLLKLAYAFEQLRQARRPPKFLPTADLHV
jgi:amidase